MRSSTVAALLSCAALACKTPGPHGPPGDDRGSASPTTTTTAHDAALAPDAPGMVQLYARGKFFTAPAATATEHDGCIGTPDDLAACKQINPNARCELGPWVDAGKVYCSGAAMGPGDMGPPMPPSACACTCSAEYIKAYDAWSARLRVCANAP
jgi:hypothetical protein